MPDTTNAELLCRLQTIEGHVRGIQRMVEQGDECIGIIHQLLGVQGAVQKVSARVLERHLRTCVAGALNSDDPTERERVIEEILNLFATMGKL